ncbi:TrkA C-terminal domain-containing protein [Sulfurimonas sp. HSL-1656]|uniref:COG3400 family protein n=1 Tax=Thiomicrolovo subterrani TaxID=3131934 RepID=UPI0031F8034D
MKKILIITDCTIGEHLVERAIEAYSKDNLYYVIQMKDRKYEKAGPDRFKFFTFDPTSRYKLSNVLKMDFVQIMLVMSSRLDAVNTLENIRSEKPSVRVIMLDQWDLKIDDPNTLTIDVNDQLSARLIDYLPNVPVIAQNVGMGEGEVMEVLVPFGSAYVYRHVGAIEQSQWRIAGIYRDQRLILPTERTLIHPNDLLLLVGEPDVLISIYRSFKRELGHFPAPYGSTIYLYIDMDVDRAEDIIPMLRKTIYVQERLRRKLYIRVTNPGDLDVLREIKQLRSPEVEVMIDYDRRGEAYLLSNDKRHIHAGFIVVSRKLFGIDAVRKVLYDLKVPVLKMASGQMHNVKRAVMLLSESEDVEKITTTMFDMASQMEWMIELLEYQQDENDFKEQVEQYYQNLSAIFSQSVSIRKSTDNPLRILKKEDRFVQCIPFSETVMQRPVLSLFSTDLQGLSFHLDHFHQLFIPVL